MKKVIFLLIIYCSCCNTIFSQTVEERIQKAERINTPEAYADAGIFCLHYSDNRGFKLLLKAAEMGSPRGMYKVSECFAKGQYTTRNDELAFYWSQKSAENDYSPAYAQLAWYYSNGIGCIKDFKKSYELTQKAIANGDLDGYYNLAFIYAKGKGVPKNKIEALKYIDIAIERERERGWSYIEGQYLAGKGEIYSLFDDKQNAIDIWYNLIDNYMGYINNEMMLAYENGANDYFPYIMKHLYDIDVTSVTSEIAPNDNYALIIGNENYRNVAKVPYARSDSFAFYLYCRYLLHIPNEQIHFSSDATLGELRRGINWLKRNMQIANGKSKVIVYYAGHGIPDEDTQSAYILPVDGTGSNVRAAYSLNSLYKTLSSIPSESVTVLLDACFSGAKREGDMLASARGVAIKVKEEKPQGNLVVVSASQGDETAYPYNEKRHGLFTYYLLEKLQESKGKITLGELSGYIKDKVRRSSIINNGKMQTPTVVTSMSEEWKNRLFHE